MRADVLMKSPKKCCIMLKMKMCSSIFHFYLLPASLLTSQQYDMLTAPITNDAFHSRVLSILSNHLNSSPDTSSASRSISGLRSIPQAPIIPRLSPLDTSLEPNDSTSQLIHVTSPWLDLCSQDPLIADISRQVLALEVDYASFCGASNIMIQGPSLQSQGHEGSGLAQYAHAVQDTLAVGLYLQIHILLPMAGFSTSHPSPSTQMGSLGDFARPEFTKHIAGDEDVGRDAMASWDAWNFIRSHCKYNTRLSVGKNEINHPLPQFNIRVFYLTSLTSAMSCKK